MVQRISESELISELSRRFDEYRRALHDLEVLTRKLEGLNAKLQSSEQMKTNFLSNIRNEINNPLTSILGLSEQIAKGNVSVEMLGSLSTMIYQEAFDLDFQLRNIFMAAELEAGECTLSVARADISMMIERLVQSIEHKTSKKGLRINVETDADAGQAIFACIDPEKLQSILMNLLLNAIEYSKDGDTININVKRSDGLLITVSDEGAGIAEDKQKEIFDRFKQLDTGVRKMHKGHGLGLSVVKALLDLMGGTITLKSVEGRGATFTIAVPEMELPDGVEPDSFSSDGNEFIFDSGDEGLEKF